MFCIEEATGDSFNRIRTGGVQNMLPLPVVYTFGTGLCNNNFTLFIKYQNSSQ